MKKRVSILYPRAPIRHSNLHDYPQFEHIHIHNRGTWTTKQRTIICPLSTINATTATVTTTQTIRWIRKVSAWHIHATEFQKTPKIYSNPKSTTVCKYLLTHEIHTKTTSPVRYWLLLWDTQSWALHRTHSTKNQRCTSKDFTKINKHRIANNDHKIIANLKKSLTEITIKPADKNLGVVILDTDDYIKQCMTILSDENTYRQVQSFPSEKIRTELTNPLVHFKSQLDMTNDKLYNYLQPKTICPTPQFYGLPKIHKKFDHLLPMRPIVFHCDSMLNPSARLLDHCL